jgi:hypothetical protein
LWIVEAIIESGDAQMAKIRIEHLAREALLDRPFRVSPHVFERQNLAISRKRPFRAVERYRYRSDRVQELRPVRSVNLPDRRGVSILISFRDIGRPHGVAGQLFRQVRQVRERIGALMAVVEKSRPSTCGGDEKISATLDTRKERIGRDTPRLLCISRCQSRNAFTAVSRSKRRKPIVSGIGANFPENNSFISLRSRRCRVDCHILRRARGEPPDDEAAYPALPG